MNDTKDLIKQIKQFFEEEAINKENVVQQFSNDVVALAYQKMSASVTDMIQNEEDPLVIAEILKNFLEVTKMIDEKGLQRQQVLLKLFEQLTKYEQSRYY
jgi:hypothetical protein